MLLHLNGELSSPRLVAAGIGPRDTVDADALRTAGAAAAQSVDRVGGTILWLLDETLPVPLPEQAAALVEGTILGAYSPGRWKTGDGGRRPLERIVLGHFDDPRDPRRRRAGRADRGADEPCARPREHAAERARSASGSPSTRSSSPASTST